MHGLTNCVTNEFADDTVVVPFNKAFDSVRNVAYTVTGSGKTYCIIERFTSGINQSCVFVSNGSMIPLCIIANKSSVTHGKQSNSISS